MAALDEATRGHEEFRLRLEKDRAIESEAIEARKAVAEAQAAVLGRALQEANIDIVGGDGVFLDRLVNSISMGKSVDGFVNRSDTVKRVFGDYLNGEARLGDDLKEMLAGIGSSDSAQNVALFALLAKMLKDQGLSSDQLARLLEDAQGSGTQEDALMLPGSRPALPPMLAEVRR